MIFNVIRPDGTIETRQHVPYHIVRYGNDWYANHAETGRKLGRFDSEEILHRHMATFTEPVPK
jgi:hypothetical protein